MTPKEKAENLIMKFYYNGIKDKRYSMEYEDGKQCALLCVDEIEKPMEYNDGFTYTTQHLNLKLKKYWQEVKQEINKL